jgi:hypothetical protein
VVVAAVVAEVVVVVAAVEVAVVVLAVAEAVPAGVADPASGNKPACHKAKLP